MASLYQISIGLNDKDTKVQEIETEKAISIIKSLALEHFEGVTVLRAYGGYTHEDGTQIDEDSIRVEIIYAEEPEIRKYVNLVKAVLNQESILVVKTETNIEFW